MARRPRRRGGGPQSAREAVPPARAWLSAHLAALGFVNEWQYDTWCERHGFPLTVEKTEDQREAELAFFEREQKRLRKNARIHHNPRRLIAAACDGEVTSADITRPVWQEIVRSIEASNGDPETRESLKAFLSLIAQRGTMLVETTRIGGQDYRFIDGLIKLHDRKALWLRPAEDWRPQSHNSDRRFASLAQHLFSNYPIPMFMSRVWLRHENGSRRFRDWYVHLGRGHNIRTAKTPFALTKKMAHAFLQAPDSYSVEAALRYGHVLGLGGDRRLAEALLASPIGTDFSNHEFWTSVVRFFIANPLLDLVHVGPIVDYLRFQKFGGEAVFEERGLVREPPPQPDLNMRGRTANALLRQVAAWHEELGRSGRLRADAGPFPKSGFAGYERTIAARNEQRPERRWVIRELRSPEELRNEGRKMHHCVASYAASCARGIVSIWALERYEGGELAEKCQTIEVNRAGSIVQCRGRYNRLPTASEFAIVEDWAAAAGLRLSQWLAVA